MSEGAVLTPLIRRFLRYSLGVSFLLGLPYAGYLWGQEDNRFAAILLGSAGMIAVVLFELLAWSRENDTWHLHELIREDEQDFAEWKERVHLLGGIVNILWQDNAELRQGHLVGEIQFTKSHDAKDVEVQPLKRIDDAASDRLALPRAGSSQASQ